MIILLEGADGTGKSTLANELSERLSVPIYKRQDNPLYGKMSVRESQLIHEAEFAMLEALDTDVIVDRWFPSEWVYDTIFKRDFDEDAIWKLDERAFWKLDIMPIRLFWPHDATAEEWAGRLDLEVDSKDVYEANEQYRNYINSSKLRWQEINCLKPMLSVVECVMRDIVDRRPSKDETYMRMAKDACRRSTCLSRRTGALLLDADGCVIMTGYNGAPRGCPHQQTCERLRGQGTGSGQDLDKCTDVHAEENCLVQAGNRAKGGAMYTVMSPCHRCARQIINARLTEVIYERAYGDTSSLELLKQGGVKVRQLNEPEFRR